MLAGALRATHAHAEPWAWHPANPGRQPGGAVEAWLISKTRPPLFSCPYRPCNSQIAPGSDFDNSRAFSLRALTFLAACKYLMSDAGYSPTRPARAGRHFRGWRLGTADPRQHLRSETHHDSHFRHQRGNAPFGCRAQLPGRRRCPTRSEPEIG